MSEQAVFLLVDDDPNDATLMRRAFVRARILNPLVIVSSGEEAIDYLSGVGRYSNRAEYPLPALVLLDLRMPGMDGFEVLQWIRAKPGVSSLRVVILSGSDGERDVNRAYQLGANSYLVKPTHFDRFVEISQAVGGHWLWMSQAPEAERAASRSATDDSLWLMGPRAEVGGQNSEVGGRATRRFV